MGFRFSMRELKGERERSAWEGGKRNKGYTYSHLVKLYNNLSVKFSHHTRCAV